MILSILLQVFVSFFASAAENSLLQESGKGWVRLSLGHELYVDYEKAKPGQPTVVLVNGLVYDFSRWNTLVQPLRERGYGVLRYYFRGQQETLRKEASKGKPAFFDRGIQRKDFVTELHELLTLLEVKQSILVGLSYGAGIIAEYANDYPQEVQHLVFLAPLVISLDRYDIGGAWIHWNLDMLRYWWGPVWGPVVYDQYYEWIYKNFLNSKLTNEKVPQNLRDIADIYKESIFHQVRAMRDFDLRSYSFHALAGKVHLILASEEEDMALEDQFESWAEFSPSARGSLVYLSPSYHAIPDSTGEYTALLIDHIASGNVALREGNAFYAITKRPLHEIQQVKDAATLKQLVLKERSQTKQDK